MAYYTQLSDISFTQCDLPDSTITWNEYVIIRTPSIIKPIIPSFPYEMSDTMLKHTLEITEYDYTIETRVRRMKYIKWTTFLSFLHYDCIKTINICQSYITENMMKELVEILEKRTLKRLILGNISGPVAIYFLKYLSCSPRLIELWVEGQIDSEVINVMKTNYILEKFKWNKENDGIVIDRCKINKWNIAQKQIRLMNYLEL